MMLLKPTYNKKSNAINNVTQCFCNKHCYTMFLEHSWFYSSLKCWSFNQICDVVWKNVSDARYNHTERSLQKRAAKIVQKASNCLHNEKKNQLGWSDENRCLHVAIYIALVLFLNQYLNYVSERFKDYFVKMYVYY